jgi:hypothetical protein
MTDQEKIDQIMDTFNFHCVVVAMRATNWQWVRASEKDGIPTEYEIRREARRLLRDVLIGPHRSIKTGGLCASLEGDILHLSFELDWAEAGDAE